MYAKFSGGQGVNTKGLQLKPYHHVKLDAEFKQDCKIWKQFLSDVQSVVRPFIDLDASLQADIINFYSDASANKDFGYGAVFGDKWIFGRRERNFIQTREPSIEFLELFALCAGIFTWSEHLAGTRIVVFCDNISVVYMVNNLTSSCIQCMKLIRLLTLDNLKNDRQVFVRHVRGKNNQLSDALSRQDLNRFFRLAPSTMNLFPDKV